MNLFYWSDPSYCIGQACSEGDINNAKKTKNIMYVNTYQFILRYCMKSGVLDEDSLRNKQGT